MSKNIVIVNNGVQETWSGIDCIRTNGANTQKIDWLPEDETSVVTLTVTENGTYTAAGASVYGFGSVVANIPPQVTGTINNVQYVVTVDANGYLVYTPVE